MADTINERFMDFQVAQQIRWIRMQNREVAKALAVLRRVDKQLGSALRAADDGTPYTQARLQALRAQVESMITAIHAQIVPEINKAVTEAAQAAADIEESLFRRNLPAGLDITTPNPGVVQKAATLKPFNGEILSAWTEGVKQSDLNRTWRAIQDGIVMGETTPALISRLNGSVREVSKRGMEALVRTSINHATNQGRQALWEQNADIVGSIKWVATLDGRTSPICRHRDGKVGPVSPAQVDWQVPMGYAQLEPAFARPPAHPNCRSTTVAVTKSWKELGFDVDELPPGTRASMDGQVPADLTYYEWLRRQSDDVQRDILGPSRFDLWKSGKVTPDKFMNDKGKYLTVTDLRKLADLKDDVPTGFIDFRNEFDMSSPVMAALDAEAKIKTMVDLIKYNPADFGLDDWGDIDRLKKMPGGLAIPALNDAHMVIIKTAQLESAARYKTALRDKLIRAQVIKGTAKKRDVQPAPIGTPASLKKKDQPPAAVLADKQKDQDPFLHVRNRSTEQPEIPWAESKVVSTVKRNSRIKNRLNQAADTAYQVMPNWVLNEIGDVYKIDVRKRRANYDFVNRTLNMSYDNDWTVWVHEMFHALDFKYRLPKGAKGFDRYEPRDSLDWNTDDKKLNKLAALTRQEFIDRDSKGKGRYRNGDGSYWLGDWDQNYEGRAYSFDQKVSSEYITMAAQNYAWAITNPAMPRSKIILKRMREKQPAMLSLLEYIFEGAK